jgi:hypothetical protein
MRRHSTRLSQAHEEEPEDDGLSRTADRDYPELGTILDDRPDPGGVITVIGARRLANLYGTDQDDRNGQFNGEPGDAGMYWSEPGQQQWTQENEPQEPAPPPPWAMSPVMARLAELEEAAGLIGMSHHATSINGQQVDDHGDAPQHGTVPRAQDPDSYDDRSTEGDGDPKWDDPLDPAHKEEYNGATVGMYPEGISAGGGPGISVGPVTAELNQKGQNELRRHMAEDHLADPSLCASSEIRELADDHAADHDYGNADHAHGPDYDHRPFWDEGADAGRYHEFTGSRRTARVPWTPAERGTLHTWQQVPTGTWGDFVPSSEFPFLRPGESQHGPEEEDLRAEGSWEPYEADEYDFADKPSYQGWPQSMPEEYEPRDWTDIADRADHRNDAGGWVHHTLSSLREGASDAEDRYWRAHLRDQHGWSAGQFERARQRGDSLPDMHAAGHEAGLAGHPPHAISAEQRLRAQRDLEREDSLRNMFGPDITEDRAKLRPEGYGLAHPARGGYSGGDPMTAIMTSGDPRPVADPSHWEQADPARFRRMMSALTAHAHDDEGDSLDDGPASGDFGVGDEEDEDGPEGWPAAGADVSETGRAMTQGRYDGKTRRSGDQGHLAAFVAASGSPSFRFHFTASWQDVIAKARRIRADGHVRITHASAGLVIGEVRGDHDTYETGIQRPVGKRQSIQHWACGCPWASFHQSRTAARRPGGYAGRPCSHVMALQFEAQSRGMFGRQFGADENLPSWSPPTVVVKSMPPWEGEPHAGRWREEWRAPVASIRRAATPDEARDADWTPEDRDEWERSGAVVGWPCQRATAALLRSGADPEEVDALRAIAGLGPVSADAARSGALLARHLTVAHGLPEEKAAELCRDVPGALGWHGALHEARAAVAIPHRHEPPGAPGAGLLPVEGLRVTADGANGPWGSDNTVSHPPQKPYGATSPPDKDMDPGSYGPLAAPDPENWGRIDAGDVFQMPIGNTAAVRPVPGDLHWPDQSQDEQGTFSYQDRAAAAGPSTAMTPRDPNGIRMEETRRDCPCCGGTGEHNTGRECYGCDASGSADGYSGQVPCDGTKPYGVDSEGHQVELDPLDGWQHLDGSVSHDDGSTVSDHPVRAELRDEPEAALPSTTGDDLEATAAADGTMGGGDAGDGAAQEAPLDVASLGEFGASAREEFRRKFGGPTAMGDRSVAEGLSGGAQEPPVTGQQPGMGSMDEPLTPDDQSIQTIGGQQWSGGGADSDEVEVEPGQPQGGIDDIVASFQRSAAARAYAGGGAAGGGAAAGPGDIAGAARAYLAKTAEVLPQAEADELIREGRGQRARNLDLLDLEGTHYADADEELGKKGLSMDDHDDDVIFA